MHGVGRLSSTALSRAAIAACAIVALSAVPAAALEQHSTAQPIYAAFSVVKKKPFSTRKCGAYTIVNGTYGGTSTSPDRRLGGVATLVLRTVVDGNTGTGVTAGTLDIRDSRTTRRLHSRVTGVVSQRTTVNGIVSGTLAGPRATLLANVTIVFDAEYGFAAVRLGIEDGANSAVAYPALPRCR